MKRLHSAKRMLQKPLALLTCLLLSWLTACVATAPVSSVGNAKSPPKQSREATMSSSEQPFSVSKQLIGEGASAYWIFQPQNPVNTPVPVVIFLHGWMAIDPSVYGGWIDHLVRQNQIVIYPVMQTSREDSAEVMQQNAFTAIADAIRTLNRQTTVRPDWQQVALVGHSFGGGLATQVAANATKLGLPTPTLVMAVAPGWQGESLPAQSLDQISAAVNLLIVEGADDELADSRQGTTIYGATPQIPRERKVFLLMASGDENTQVTHSAPLAPLESYQNPDLSSREIRRQQLGGWIFNTITGQEPGAINFLDQNGYWKILDQAIQSAAYGQSVTSGAIQGFTDVTGQGTPDDPQRLVVQPN